MTEPVAFLSRAEALIGSPEAAAVARGAKSFLEKRDTARDQFPLFDDMRERARSVRLHSLANLDRLLARFADAVRSLPFPEISAPRSLPSPKSRWNPFVP